MRSLGLLLLLGLGACSTAEPSAPSLGVPEEQHRRMLDFIAGVPEPEPVDAEVFSFPPPLPLPLQIEGPFEGILIRLIDDEMKQPDYGLYANPIP